MRFSKLTRFGVVATLLLVMSAPSFSQTTPPTTTTTTTPPTAPPPVALPPAITPGPVCAVIIAGSVRRKGSCVGAAGCISRAGVLNGPGLGNLIPYLCCNNFAELPYNDCIPLPIANPSCWADWGWVTQCLTFDCYASIGPLGIAACTVGSMVGTDSASTDQCT